MPSPEPMLGKCLLESNGNQELSPVQLCIPPRASSTESMNEKCSFKGPLQGTRVSAAVLWLPNYL